MKHAVSAFAALGMTCGSLALATAPLTDPGTCIQTSVAQGSLKIGSLPKFELPVGQRAGTAFFPAFSYDFVYPNIGSAPDLTRNGHVYVDLKLGTVILSWAQVMGDREEFFGPADLSPALRACFDAHLQANPWFRARP